MRTLMRTSACAAVMLAALSTQACRRREAPPANTAPAAAPAAAPDTSAQPPTTTADQGGAPAAGAANGGAGYGPGAGGAGMGGPGMGRGGMGRGGMAGLSLPQFQAQFRQRMLMRADTDRDGRISLQEWIAWRNAHPRPGGGGVDPNRQFQHLDLNHDGYLTPDELDAMAARRYQRRMAMGGARMGGMGQGASAGEAGEDEGGPQ